MPHLRKKGGSVPHISTHRRGVGGRDWAPSMAVALDATCAVLAAHTSSTCATAAPGTSSTCAACVRSRQAAHKTPAAECAPGAVGAVLLPGLNPAHKNGPKCTCTLALHRPETQLAVHATSAAWQAGMLGGTAARSSNPGHSCAAAGCRPQRLPAAGLTSCGHRNPSGAAGP